MYYMRPELLAAMRDTVVAQPPVTAVEAHATPNHGDAVSLVFFAVGVASGWLLAKRHYTVAAATRTTRPDARRPRQGS